MAISNAPCQLCQNGCREKPPKSETDKLITSIMYPQQVTDSSEEETQECQLIQSKVAVLVHIPPKSCTVLPHYATESCLPVSCEDDLKAKINDINSTQLSMSKDRECICIANQTLQATCYNGVFVWPIHEIQRHNDAVTMGRTVSLYSPPFYTSPHGYKLCLRLYMGSGKNTHLSFFLTVMKGEYDALLGWPFKQTVTLMLLDQDRLKDVVQSFRPEPTCSSFQRPRNEMNVASGCPMFAPLSVLNNSSYVKDDTMFLKCKIDTAGIDVD